MRKTLLSTVFLSAMFSAAVAAEMNTVEIVFNGSTASVTVADNICSYVTDQSNGSSHVKLLQAGTVDATVGEITYILSGTSDDGEFYLEGSYKATVELNNLTLTNPSGPAVNIQNGKRIKVSAKNGTVNTLTDGLNDTYNGCLHSKGHTEFKGKGTLNIVANSKHGIYSKEYVQVKNLTLNITAAPKDGIHCKEYFLMESGVVSITGAQDDGIQVELSGLTSTGVTTDHEDEDTGNFYMLGDVLSISGYVGKAIKADGEITYSGGTQNFDTSDTKIHAGIALTTAGNTTNEAGKLFDLNGRKLTKNAARHGIYLLKKVGQTVKMVVK